MVGQDTANGGFGPVVCRRTLESHKFSRPSASRYPARVLFRLGRRLFGLTAAFFAILGFVAVPVGDRTGLEHVREFIQSETGQRLGQASVEISRVARDRLAASLASSSSSPLPSSLPSSGALLTHPEFEEIARVIEGVPDPALHRAQQTTRKNPPASAPPSRKARGGSAAVEPNRSPPR
jgi:hypothetical protein